MLFRSSAVVTAICTTPGAITAAAGTVRHLVSPVSGLSSVVNPNAATPGAEAETDASCRNRLKAAAAASSVSSMDAIRTAVLSVPNVTSCIVLENNGDAADARGIPGHSICVLFANISILLLTLLKPDDNMYKTLLIMNIINMLINKGVL